MNERFRVFARKSGELAGSPVAFLAGILVILTWLASGLWFGYSDTWQLVINTGTTIVTFLMVFVLQNTQNHDTRAVQLKLDELLRAVRAARTELIRLEDFSDEELENLHNQFLRLAAKPRQEDPAAVKDQ